MFQRLLELEVRYMLQCCLTRLWHHLYLGSNTFDISHYTKISCFSGSALFWCFIARWSFWTWLQALGGALALITRTFWLAMWASQSWPQKFMPWMDWLEPVVSNQLIWLYVNLAFPLHLQRDSCLQPGVEVDCLPLCNSRQEADCYQWCRARPRMFL
jgi:hypothetical protein